MVLILLMIVIISRAQFADGRKLKFKIQSDIPSIYLDIPGNIPGIYLKMRYTWYVPGIYQVKTFIGIPDVMDFRIADFKGCLSVMLTLVLFSS